MEKPAGWCSTYGSAFTEPEVAAAYAFRPPYPPSVFAHLDRLLTGVRADRRVLDVGCGTGGLARHLTALGVSVDAVDISAAMVERGRALPGGAHPRLTWQVGPLELATLTPPYGLVTAGESLHWMEWECVLPQFARVLSPDGLLVIAVLDTNAVPWRAELIPIIKAYSTNPTYEPKDLVAELVQRGLYVESGQMLTPPWTFRQSVADYVESFHGRATLSRNRMADAEGFDRAVTELVRRYTPGEVELPVVAQISWGRPTQSGPGVVQPGPRTDRVQGEAVRGRRRGGRRPGV
jgi:SAM-dependent methyltransferase